MNIVKKLKLALLATSVMLFPKAGHSMMKSEDEGGKTGSSIQRAGPEDETASVSLQPASSSNSLPAASAALTLQQTLIPGASSREQMQWNFDREFYSSEEIGGALQSLRTKLGNEQEYNTALEYIRENIFNQYVFPYKWVSSLQGIRHPDIDINDNTMKDLGPTLRNLALTSLNIVLEGGTDALENRLNKINEIVYHRLHNVAMNSPIINAPKAQKDKLYYLSSIKKFLKPFSRSQRNPHYISLISDLLRLQPEQMGSFTSIINNKKRFMEKIHTNDSPFLPVISDIDANILREERISVLGFLAKKSTEELNEIQNELEKLVPEKSRGSRMHRNILEALVKLDFDTFKARADRFAPVLQDPYKGLEPDLASLSLMVEGEDFNDYAHLVKDNLDLFIPNMRTKSGDKMRVINPPLWELSFKEIKERILAINAHSSLSYKAPEEDAASNIEGAARFMALTPAEIYKIAKSQSSGSIESGPASSSGSSIDQEKIRQMTPSSSSTPAPVVNPALELDIREFHMGKRNDYPTTGFSALENTHRWTVGKEATITIPLAGMERRPSRISFLNTAGFVTAGHPQNLTVKMNGEVVGRYEYTPRNNNQTIDIDLPKIGPAEIEFEIPTAISPSVLVGTNPDKRELGILFREVEFHY